VESTKPLLSLILGELFDRSSHYPLIVASILSQPGAGRIAIQSNPIVVSDCVLATSPIVADPRIGLGFKISYDPQSASTTLN
jgi:hypothetical protein